MFWMSTCWPAALEQIAAAVFEWSVGAPQDDLARYPSTITISAKTKKKEKEKKEGERKKEEETREEVEVPLFIVYHANVSRAFSVGVPQDCREVSQSVRRSVSDPK